jgi:hypothetical protein
VEGQPVSQVVKECQTGTLRAKTDRPASACYRQLPYAFLSFYFAANGENLHAIQYFAVFLRYRPISEYRLAVQFVSVLVISEP